MHREAWYAGRERRGMQAERGKVCASASQAALRWGLPESEAAQT